jgi:hypothetical protein
MALFHKQKSLAHYLVTLMLVIPTTAMCQSKSPESKGAARIVYSFSPTLTVVEHGDTITYIKRSGGATSMFPDTMTYVVKGDTAVLLRGSSKLVMPAGFAASLKQMLEHARAKKEIDAKLSGVQ